jgi:hypothetical protein
MGIREFPSAGFKVQAAAMRGKAFRLIEIIDAQQENISFSVMRFTA